MTRVARAVKGFCVEPYAVYSPAETKAFDWFEEAPARARCGVPFVERVDFDDFVGYAAYQSEAPEKSLGL